MTENASENKPHPITPLRLADAVTHGFPLGGMTVSGLRREIARGRLVVEVIAGKHFTTLAAIEAMRELCRRPVKRNVWVQPSADPMPDGTSIATAALLARLRAQQEADRAERAATRLAKKAAQR